LIDTIGLLLVLALGTAQMDIIHKSALFLVSNLVPEKNAVLRLYKSRKNTPFLAFREVRGPRLAGEEKCATLGL
jgi:hypothetical protein